MIIPNFKLINNNWAQYEIVQRKCNWTKSGSIWNSIRNRCNPNNKWQIIAPEYVGCTMSDNFKDFNFFVEWHTAQIGFEIDGYTIDKDILFSGNKEYHEGKCILVPQALNNFFISHLNRHNLPQGVSYHSFSGKFRATMSSFGKCIHIGLYRTPQEAHVAYKEQKQIECAKWIDIIKQGLIIVDSRVLERLQNYNL